MSFSFILNHFLWKAGCTVAVVVYSKFPGGNCMLNTGFHHSVSHIGGAVSDLVISSPVCEVLHTYDN